MATKKTMPKKPKPKPKTPMGEEKSESRKDMMREKKTSC